MAYEAITNGGFNTNLSGWTSSGVVTSVLGEAQFLTNGSALSQDVTGLIAGSELDFSFNYNKLGVLNGSYLTYDLLFSTDSFATSVSLIGGPDTFGSGDGDQLVSFGGLTLASDGDVRVMFSRGSRLFAVDGVSLDITAPAPVPEPETYALMLAGLGAVGFAARRRRGRGS
jgi:hypothetical protein